MTLITLPSPPKYKTVDDKKDIKKCLDYLNSLELTPVISNGKGWWFMIKIDNSSTITFEGQHVSFDGRTYRIRNSDYASTLRSLYSSLNYEEGDWGR